MTNPVTLISRRDFLSTSTTAMAVTALGPARLTAASRMAPSEKMIGIQVGAVSFLDEGTEAVLDNVEQLGAVNALFLGAFSYGTGFAGRQQAGEPFPDHGKKEYDQNFHGGNFAIPHAKFYGRTSLKETRAPDHGDYDVLADVVPKARRRGLKVYAWYEDHFPDELSNEPVIPGLAALKEVDWQGRPARTLCHLHPDYRGFVTGLTEDYCQSHDIDGVMWGSERQGPLNNAISAKPGRSGDSSRVTCFCEFHQKAARERGIDVARAKEGFKRLDQFVRAARAGQRPNDGYFVEFWRLLLNYPELLAWEKLWTDTKHQTYADVYSAAKQSRPSIQVGFHIWHLNSFSPFFRAEQDYAAFTKVADFLKIAAYNNCGGSRYVTYNDVVASTLFGDVPKEQLLSLYNRWLDYPNEAPIDRLPKTGMSPDYVAREMKRALKGVQGTACKIYGGLDIDISTNTPTDVNRNTMVPEDAYASTSAALKAGADGVVFSRRYAEMKLTNLAGAGKAVRDFYAGR